VATRHGPKKGGDFYAPFAGAGVSWVVVQHSVAWAGLLLYQVASSSIQLCGHNKHRPKIRWDGYAFFLGVAGAPSKTKSPGTRPTCIPSGILVHPAVWPLRTLADNWGGTVPLYGRGAGSPSNTKWPRLRPSSISNGILMHPAIWPQ